MGEEVSSHIQLSVPGTIIQARRVLIVNQDVKQALQRDRTIDITGTPGRRDWYSNMLANPEFTFHLKQSTQANVSARATPILDKGQRRAIIAEIHRKLSGDRDLDAWVEGSPLVEVELLG